MKTQFLIKTFFVLLLSINPLLADQNKEAMIKDLDSIKRLFEVNYAPAEWKKENDSWDISSEYDKTVKKITVTNNLSLKKYQQCLRNFTSSSKDYHVGIIFYSTESATLPFRVKTIDKRTFIDYVNRNKLEKQSFSLREGDELLEFNGVPAQAAIACLLENNSKNSNPLTDLALADVKLTRRVGALGDEVPKGPVTIVFRTADGEVKTNQLIWEYFPEYVKTPSSLMQTIPFFFSMEKEKEKKKLSSPYTLFNPIHELYAANSDGEDGGLGSRMSFVPILGSPTWVWEGSLECIGESDAEPEVDSRSNYPMWNAYIYENVEGRSIGYIRIPHYVGSQKDSFLFGKIISYMEKNTEALVIDQLNNFGGSVSFCYDLAAMLTTKTLTTPKHRIKINQEDVFRGIGAVEEIDQILSLLKQGTLQSLLKLLGIDEPGFSYQKLLFVKYFHQFIIDEWSQGHILTDPIFIDGVDVINPNPEYHYSKPILFLINELDFSGGDFMPAILQDNKRVVLFGSRTAGAGGFVLNKTFPNQYGVARVTITGSIAEREGKGKIESLGVTPDIEYKMTADDVQNRYVNYGKTVNEVLSTLLPSKSGLEPKEGEYEPLKREASYYYD